MDSSDKMPEKSKFAKKHSYHKSANDNQENENNN